MVKGSIQILLIVFVSASAAAVHALLPLIFPADPNEGILYSISNTQHGTYAGWEKCIEDESYQTCNSAVSQFQDERLYIAAIKVGSKTCDNDPAKVAVTVVNTSSNISITSFHLRPYFYIGGEYKLTFLPQPQEALQPKEIRTTCLFEVNFTETASRNALMNTPAPITLQQNYIRGVTL
ncbi:hypothetical protein [Kordiimonas laminariae]|uniref:hypothetical protein n=1 Tax=Kordiimonas laminariae TaxID=2917717 RepID=UPI001FF2FE60|nr:hypothetical protein [Kordiimonas laminariae]MCK0069072.1 hypothetical protein [Kordiimonas laminariae]